MANIGFSQPYYAKYAAANGAVTYTGLQKLGKGTQVDVSVDNAEPQILYADNGPAEAVTLFSGGEVTLGIDELSLAVAADVLGLEVSGTTMTFYADAQAPYVGLGFIAKKIFENSVKWRMVVLYKCMFEMPDYSISTQGESVEFQTPSLTARIFKDDTTGTNGAKWSKWADFETEAAALAALQTELGGTAATT